MNTGIVGRHIELTDTIKNHINASIETFKKFNLDIISVNAVVSKESKYGKVGFTFEFAINVANIDTVVIKQKDKDLHSAIDIATDRVNKFLRRHHDKISGHKALRLSDVEINETEDLIANELEKLENEIVPVKLKSYKPMDIEEALEELKAGGDVFKVFYDKDSNLRVLYRLKTEGQFGLY
ncbi:MAG: ribosome-associated translation inhibitor RaiA [Arcobacter butzleri]|nr:ribosome-associated translation inhibitor RaiA [Aliarcobacter butzleri]